MKLMTLNTHSLVEENYRQKLSDFVSGIIDIKPDIIALQEVNQSLSAEKVGIEMLKGYYPCRKNIIVNEDNHVYNAVKLLRENGLDYYWTWLPIKCGYDRYEEGIALMSRFPVTETKVISVSRINDYYNWKTRKIIGIRSGGISDEWFFSVHYGWWEDKEEPFENHWRNTLKQMPYNSDIWLMGDFNNPADIRNEGYDLVISDGWLDSYHASKTKDEGITVDKVIDGWKGKLASDDGMRIDLIISNRKKEILSSKVVFNGINCPVVSDHFGVVVDYKRSML